MSLIGLLQELRPEIISSRAKIERARIAENSKTILGFIDDFELLVQSSRLRNKLKLFIFFDDVFKNYTAAGIIFAKNSGTIT